VTEDSSDDWGEIDPIDTLADDGESSKTVTVVVVDGEERHELTVPTGANLREMLLNAELSPYARLTERANCGGRGLCATCGVRVHGDVAATHWHDALAARFGYPRLSCQLEATDGLVVELDREKRVWGARE
jgi:ferredoxin